MISIFKNRKYQFLFYFLWKNENKKYVRLLWMDITVYILFMECPTSSCGDEGPKENCIIGLNFFS